MILAGAAIEKYYRQIDAQDVDSLMGLFAEDAIYFRCESELRGRSEILRFFSEERKIRGVHHIETLLSLGDRVVAIGRFEGKGAVGDARSVGFVDVWEFNEAGRIRRRRTFLATGSQFIKS
jgi:ketosteroid isomerase-like protein